jgi:uncharacterized protein
VEIDLVAIDEDARRIRFGTCKRATTKLRAALDNCRAHILRFLEEHRGIDGTWTVERVAIAPRIDAQARREIEARGFMPQDLEDLIAGL